MADTARIEVVVATAEQEPVLANLLELYAHDFSEFHDVQLRVDGRFGYRELPLYWVEEGRLAFLVKVDGRLAGFVLVKRGSPFSGNDSVWDVAEFFVVRRYRRRGVGSEVARRVWAQISGPWEVRVMESNQSAVKFWERAIAGFAGEASGIRVEVDGAWWRLFSFESGTASRAAKLVSQ